MPAYNSSFTGQEIDDILTNFLNRAYPIGSVYMSMIDTNPSALFGGTWVLIKDKFIVSAGDTYTGGDTGGTDTHTHSFTAVGTVENHTLTIAEMPAHTHNQYANVGNAINGLTNLDDIGGCSNINAYDQLIGARSTTSTGGGGVS